MFVSNSQDRVIPEYLQHTEYTKTAAEKSMLSVIVHKHDQSNVFLWVHVAGISTAQLEGLLVLLTATLIGL